MKEGMHLPTKGVVALGIGYAIISVAFGIVSVKGLIATDGKEAASLRDILFISTSTALSIASLFYIRKLYKDTFAGLTKESGEDSGISSAATALYYVTRPLFAVSISILFSVLMFSAIRQFSYGHVGVNSDFILFSAISSFVLSIATGAGVSRLEELAASGHSFFRIPM